MLANNIKRWSTGKLMERTVKALKANFFDAAFFADRKDLIEHILGYAKPKMRIGFGGSTTVRALDIVERLSEKDVLLFDHWKEGLSREEIAEVRNQQLTSDIFFTGANAITEKGEIVNMDGIGNRVNATTFGPGKVIIIAGYNKIVPDIASAIDRIKRHAAPMNAKRLNLPLPCVETGYCNDCKSELRICRILSILQKKPSLTDISVLLLHEEIGL